jgi:hypothetical protein
LRWYVFPGAGLEALDVSWRPFMTEQAAAGIEKLTKLTALFMNRSAVNNSTTRCAIRNVASMIDDLMSGIATLHAEARFECCTFKLPQNQLLRPI